MEGLTDFPQDYRVFVDEIWKDIFPETTREIEAWENQFGIIPSQGASESTRRMALDVAWKARGGQSPKYLQDLLRDAGFDVYIHEWWYYDGLGVRQTRDPRLYIAGGALIYVTVCGETDDADYCGDPEAVCGETIGAGGKLLVNKGPGDFVFLYENENYCGDPESVCGEPDVVCGGVIGFGLLPFQYVIPDDPDKWPYFIYVGGETFPDFADVPAIRQDEFERLILKYFPGQLWVGLLINYV